MEATQSKAPPGLLPQKRQLEPLDFTFSASKLPNLGPGALGVGPAGVGFPNGGAPVGTLGAFTPPPGLEMASGTQVINLEIPQAQVQGVLGAQAATIKAIRAISGAQCVVKQQHPRPDAAVLTISGTPTQVEKCKGLVVALVEGDPGKVPAVDALGAVAAAGSPALTSAPLPVLPGAVAASLAASPRAVRPGAAVGSLGVRPCGLLRAPGAGGAAGLLGALPLSLSAPSASPRPTLGKAPGAVGSAGSLAAALSALSGSRPPAAASPLSSLGLAGLTGASAVDLAKLGSLAGLASLAGAPGAGAAASTSPGDAVATAAAAASLATAAADPGGAGSLASLLSTLGAAGAAAGATGGGTASSLYTQLAAAALQLTSGQTSAGTAIGETTSPLRKQQEQAFDREALARLAKQAQENQANEEAAAAAAAATAAPPPVVPIVQPAAGGGTMEAAAASASGVGGVAWTGMAEGLAPAVAQEAAPLAPLPASALVPPPTQAPAAPAAPAPLSGTVAVLAALGGGLPVQGTGGVGAVASGVGAAPPVAAAGALAEEVAKTKKDSSSVLGILQQAQDNLAKNRAGGARGAALGVVPKEFEIASSGGGGCGEGVGGGGGSSLAAGSQLESLTGKLQAVAASPTTETRRSVEKEALALLPKLEPSRAAELVARVHAIEYIRNPEFLDALARALVPNVPKHTSPHLTRLTGTLASWALSTGVGSPEDGKVRLSEDLRNFFGAVTSEVGMRLMDVQPADMARIATALASLGLGSLRLFASLARAAVARSDRFAAHELVSLVGAFDKARVFNTALLEALTKCLKANIKEVGPKDVLRGMRALAAGGLRDEELAQAVGENMPKKAASGGLSAEDFCSLAWTFCALDLHHDRLFRAVFRALEDAAVVASETLCQLYEIHLTLKAFHHDSYKAYELEDDTVQSLRDHYKRHRGGGGRHLKLERSSEKIHADITEVLREVVDASVSAAHQTTLGFVVDIAVLRKRGSSNALVMLDVDGPSTLLRSLDPADTVIPGTTQGARVRGAVALKRRVLQKHGGKVGVVSEDEWMALENHRQKREHLRDILLKAGFSEDRLL